MEVLESDAPANACQKILNYLHKVREPLAEYQAKKGISTEEAYTFYSLVTAVGQYMYTSLSSMGAVLCNLVPIVDAVLLIFRFILDKLIDVLEAESKDRAIKGALFVVEFVPIFFIVGFIYGFIFMPLLALFLAVFTKFWHFLV